LNTILSIKKRGFQIALLLLSILIIGQDGFGGTLEKSTGARYTKKRKAGQGGRGRQGQFEVFKDNLDIFLGPSFNIASGNFIDNQKGNLASSNKSFVYTDKPTTSFLYFMAGAQYRFVLDPKSDVSSYFSFGFGFLYQKRGFTHALEMINKSVTLYEDKINLTEKYRAHYISLPITARVGKAFYGELGVSLDFLAAGTLYREMERGTFGDSTNIEYYSTFYKKDYTTRKVQPIMSIGYCLGVGYNFTSNVGVRLFGTLGKNYFAKGSDFDNLQLSFQLVGIIN